MKKILLAIGAALLFAGCATTTCRPAGWYNENGESNDKVEAQCKYSANTQSVDASVRLETFEACMVMNGFRHYEKECKTSYGF
ncbi:MAG: membrane lipoprotein lipid attachment site-containing protein [Fibrobacter sp.]|nr:membrane lipoprotein lipid attachment site-containing protein [Fibrobacter sp.]